MLVQTSRFGKIEIAEDRVITFPKGLLGFASCTQYCLLEPNNDACFYWLQSTEDPSLAFVVTDPSLFVTDYSVPIRPEQMEGLSLERFEDAKVLVIVNKIDHTLTGNLQGPLVVNLTNCQAEQLVLVDKRWSTRHPLMTLPGAATAPRAMSA